MSKRQLFWSKILSSFLVSMFISFTLTIVNKGFPPTFISIWFKGWSIAFIVASILSFFIPNLASKIILKIIK